MAITTDEWKKLERLLDDKLEEKLESKLEKKLEEKLSNKLGTQQTRFDKKLEDMDSKFSKNLKSLGEEIITEITGYIDESIIPLINEKADKIDIKRIERKLDDAIDKLYGHEARISDIENVPVVAHHLSIKKSKKKKLD